MKKIWQEAMEFWNAKPAHAQYELWFQEMKRYDYTIVAQGLSYLKREKRYFPSVSEWLAIVDSINDVRQDKLFTKENKDAKAFWAAPANDWKPLIKLLSGEITRGEFLAEMKAKGQMDMSELERFYEKEKLPLNLKAGTQDFKKQIPVKYKQIEREKSNGL